MNTTNQEIQIQGNIIATNLKCDFNKSGSTDTNNNSGNTYAANQ